MLQQLLPYLLAISSGLLLQFAFPNWELEVFVWIWLLPLLSVLWPINADAPRLKRPFRLGYSAGLAFFLPSFFWVRHSSRVIHGALDQTWIGWGGELLGLLAAVGLAAYLSLYFGLWAWFTTRIARPDNTALTSRTAIDSNLASLRSSALAAAAWTATEWLRGWMLSGFGWNHLGVALYRNTSLVQVADIIGSIGLSFLPVFIACVGWLNIVRMVRHWRGESQLRTRADFSVAILSLLVCALYGLSHLSQSPPADSIRLRTLLVQPNLAQVTRWQATDVTPFYDQLFQRTQLYVENRSGGESDFDLVVWPESALPVPLDVHPDALAFHESFLNGILKFGPFALVTGGESAAPEDKLYNSTMLFQDDFSNRQLAHKIHLVPFGEYLPFRNQLKIMETLFGAVLPGDFLPGNSTEPLQMIHPATDTRIDLIPLLCFEDTLGRLARKFVRPAPQILVNITNDGWFLHSSGPRVHLANAVLRSVELRRPMIRAANTGVSAFIDPFGRITSTLHDPLTGSHLIEGCLPGIITVSPNHHPITFYARFGESFALACLSLCSILAFVNRKKTRPA